MIQRQIILGLSLLCCLFPTGHGLAQDSIVLRDLTLVRGKSVSDFDNLGVVLSDGSKLGWDQILKAQTTPDRQPEFNRRLEEFGVPLFRLKTRIKNSDWAGAGEIAEAFLAAGSLDHSNPLDADTAYLIHLAAMKSRLQRAARSAAVWNFIQAATLQPKVSQQVLELVSSSRLPDRDTGIQLSREILPIWFDREPLEQAVGQLSAIVKDGETPAPGLAIYLASMKMELGQIDSAAELIRSLDSADEELTSWRVILESRIENETGDPIKSQAILAQKMSSLVGGANAVANYYQGIAALDFREPRGADDPIDVDRSKAILTLLRIPALYGDTYPHLSAAAIFQSAEIAELRGLRSEEQKLREELLRHYPRTYHGAQKTTQISK